jgi:hypothetical protein
LRISKSPAVMSSMKTGWNFVEPPPITGRTGLFLTMPANLLKK